LIGCGGGSSDNSAAPANTTTTYNIKNQTLYDFKTVSVVDNTTGAVTQTASLNCASQAAGCVFYYTGPVFQNGETLLFKDGNDQLVSAYVSSFEQQPYEDVIVSPWYTGLYLYKELNKRDSTIAAMSQDVIESKFDTFTLNYDSPDGTDDFYEEIAAYYAYKLKASQLTLPEFLDNLAQRLKDGEVANASEFGQIVIASSPLRAIQTAFQNLWDGKQSLVSPAFAESGGGCPDGVSWFLGVFQAIAGGVQNAFPLAGTVASASGSLANSACDSSNLSLADIMNKLNRIHAAIDALRDDLARLTALVADSNINDALSRFSTVATQAHTLGGQYSSLLKTSKTDSLLAYVQKTGDGTLADVLNKYPNGALNNLMSSVLGNQQFVNNILALTDSKFRTMVSSIQAKCGNITVDDIVSIRVQCNLAVNESLARLLASQKIALSIANDVYQVADAFPVEANHRYSYSGNRAQVFAELKTQFDNQLSFLKNSYQAVIVNSNPNEKGYYNAYDGLPADLANNMKDVYCWNYKNDVPAIAKWIKESGTEYIETLCHVGGQNGSNVLARYYFRLNGANVGNTNVANVLGVLVEKKYVTGSDLWYVGSRYTSSQWLKNYGVVLQLSGEAPVPYRTAINNNNSRDANIVGLKTDGYGALQRTKDSPSPFPSSYTRFNAYTEYDYRYTWIRVTDKNYYSYVFNLATKRGNDGYDYAYLYCVTGDCTISDSFTNTISFEKGKGPSSVYLSQAKGATNQDPYAFGIDGKFD
jgi:hypothetical protein